MHGEARIDAASKQRNCHSNGSKNSRQRRDNSIDLPQGAVQAKAVIVVVLVDLRAKLVNPSVLHILKIHRLHFLRIQMLGSMPKGGLVCIFPMLGCAGEQPDQKPGAGGTDCPEHQLFWAAFPGQLTEQTCRKPDGHKRTEGADDAITSIAEKEFAVDPPLDFKGAAGQCKALPQPHRGVIRHVSPLLPVLPDSSGFGW